MAWYENIFSRSFGGTYEDYVVDPFISGYGYPYFTLPSAIFGNDFSSISRIRFVFNRRWR